MIKVTKEPVEDVFNESVKNREIVVLYRVFHREEDGLWLEVYIPKAGEPLKTHLLYDSEDDKYISGCSYRIEGKSEEEIENLIASLEKEILDNAKNVLFKRALTRAYKYSFEYE